MLPGLNWILSLQQWKEALVEGASGPCSCAGDRRVLWLPRAHPWGEFGTGFVSLLQRLGWPSPPGAFALLFIAFH